MTRSLTGDPLTDELLPIALQMIWAVREQDSEAVADLFAAAEEVAGDPVTAAQGIALVAFALCQDDLEPSKALAWVANPEEYVRLRAEGVDAITAGVLASQTPRKEVA
jgi:hypothetical protein